ncbi:exosome nuclease subunit [Blastocladiella emersonii ATCC 22665]|nr:exosome nuclease subunit [Blastocladiella emersonii ATCC 22665]
MSGSHESDPMSVDDDVPTSSAAPLIPDMNVFHKATIAAAVKATKATGPLHPEALMVQKSENPAFATALGASSLGLLQLSNSLFKYLAGETKVKGFSHAHDVQERWLSAVEVIDGALDKADRALDQFYGRHAEAAPSPATTASGAMLATVKQKDRSMQVVHAANVVRPQQAFLADVDNSATLPFVPKLREKPHATVPLDLPQSLEGLPVDHAFPHPYAYELARLEYPARMFEAPVGADLDFPPPLEESPYTWVDTVPALTAMLDKLCGAREVAVDLEHHSYRSYHGFTSLMQVSALGEDWVVDTLALRTELYRMNVVTADPAIVKVFHGATSDVVWLQRDLGLYLVNLFDTYHATKVLQFPAHSLAYLLKHYCGVDADKKYQLADWRIRPLPAEMLKYARTDTHYLIYIYHKMRGELLSAGDAVTHNLLRATLRKSAETAGIVHVREPYDPETGRGPSGWANLYGKYNKPLTRRSFAVFKAIHHWRDTIARDEDESTRYVLPNHMLFVMADKLPTEPAEVLACCTPIPPMVRTYAADIALLVKNVLADFTDLAHANAIATLPGAIPMPEPTHIRFGDDEDAMDVCAADLGDGGAITPYVRKYSPVKVVAVHRSAMFGSSSGSKAKAKRTLATPISAVAANRVKQIEASLSSVEALLPKLLVIESVSAKDEQRAPHEPPGAHLFAPSSAKKVKQEPGAEPAVKKEPEVIVINPRARAQTATAEAADGSDSAAPAMPERKRKRGVPEQTAKYDFAKSRPAVADEVVVADDDANNEDEEMDQLPPNVHKDSDEADAIRAKKRARKQQAAAAAAGSSEDAWNPYLEAPNTGKKGRGGGAAAQAKRGRGQAKSFTFGAKGKQ